MSALPLTKLSLCIAVLPLPFFGIRFYDIWSYSSKVRLLAQILHIPPSALLTGATIFLCVCSLPFFSQVTFKIRSYYKNPEDAHVLKRDLVFCLTVSLICSILPQWSLNVNPLHMGGIRFLWNIAIVAILILIPYCISGDMRSSVILGTIPIIILFTVNAYVFQFRERLFSPTDIFSFGVALNVLDNYSLFPTPPKFIASIFLWLWPVLCILGTKHGSRLNMSRKMRALLSVCCLVGVISVSLYSIELAPRHWREDGAKVNGYILNFVSGIKDLFVFEPNGYDYERIAAMSNQYSSITEDPFTEKEPPHIIVIMDEAFSDLSIYGKISTNTDVIPFISSMEENVISGHALSSVHGGNTANSEFEFLTGFSMAWMSPNSVPYQQYILSPSYSMVAYLKNEFDYHCIAMHPYLSDGWNRPTAYQHLGFDEMIFQEGFPQENILRKYISDKEMFDTIIKTIEEHKDGPIFIHGVSMQNHGDYCYVGENYTQSIYIEGNEDLYPESEQYLSLIHETDHAVEYLISYFEQSEENVVIVFFGDHQPILYDNLIADTYGAEFTTLDDQQMKYMIPFFVWANYDIPEKHVECTSLNYLSSYVYEAAGIPLPPYNRYLTELEAKIPSINSLGFYSLSSQCYLPFDKASTEELAYLRQYEQLQYNALFDIEHRNMILFPNPE